MDLNKIKAEDLIEFVKKGLEDLNQEKEINNTPQVKVLADSISNEGKRLTTLELTFWRPILAELNTHRMLSKNSRSSRAVPVSKIIEEVTKCPWGPREWGLNQKGMQASKEIPNKLLHLCKCFWYSSAQYSAKAAGDLANLGLHKQIVNRLLEPFMCVHTVISGTEWDNFFNLRISPLAQPEMMDLAVAMKKAMDKSTPELLKNGTWHLPYINNEDKEKNEIEVLKKVSAARCARVSYKTFDGTTDINKDLELAEKLLKDKHLSCFEHIATPCSKTDYMLSNFKGWNQYRKFVE